MSRYWLAAGAFILLVAVSTALAPRTDAEDTDLAAENTTPAESESPGEAPVDFLHDIRPILSDKCFHCHGPDEHHREAGVRFDVSEGAFGDTEYGNTPVVPGDREMSELWARVATDDEFLVMPPPESGKSLTPEEIELLGRWIDQGAPWEEHWAFVAPERPELPAVRQAEWPGNAVDQFVLARIEAAGLSPSPEADKETLIRRVTMDLTGLPPTIEEIDAFLADDSPEAYERVVDRLLESPRYGEHMARFWLDAARYGDTHGLHLDNYREMWPYRDWVVDAYNRNLPYDEFTIEQLAGDLLPDPSRDQLVATGFLRAHISTAEGGSIDEEVYVRNVVDRVVTTTTVFSALTFDCTRCHDHKYDPLTQQDFYSTFAFFNNLDGPAMDGNIKDPAPSIHVPPMERRQEVAELEAQIAQLEANTRQQLAEYQYTDPGDEEAPAPPQPRDIVWVEDDMPRGAKPTGEWQFVTAPQPVSSGERSLALTVNGQGQNYFTEPAEPLVISEGDVLFTYVYLDPANPPREIMLQWNSGQWSHRAYWGENLVAFGQDGTRERRFLGDMPEQGQWVRLEVPAAEVGLDPGMQINGWAFTQFDGTVYWDKAGIRSLSGQRELFRSYAAWQNQMLAAETTGLPGEIEQLVRVEANSRSEAQEAQLKAWFLQHACADTVEIFQPLREEIARLETQIEGIVAGGPTTLVFRERPEIRPSFVLGRGEYDQREEEVTRSTPAVLPPMSADAPLNRLGYAKWLVSPENPLTARVAVNRYWQQLFGIGIVKTSEDFGSQGSPPSHPQLLDWLAVEFRESGWDVKALMKLMVMSNTYRQQGHMTPELLEIDPDNRLLARGPRFRLDAEQLRDQALFVSGLLVEQMGGPSVKPPQPGGLWKAVGYSGSNTVQFVPDTGAERVHRRTLYTFIKRTSPPPQMSTFDAPSRESCTVRRERTNTPLQALLLLNDPQFVEAARAMAERTLHEGGADDAERIAYMYRLASGRHASESVVAELSGLLTDARDVYAADAAGAAELIAIGEFPPEEQMSAIELASWTLVANTVLNLDVVINKN